MKGNTIAKLAVAGLLTGAMATGSACKSTPDEEPAAQPAETSGKPDETQPAEPAATAPADPSAAAAGEVHDCAGKNSCRGFGGCAVTAEKLAELAKAAGVDAAAAGEAHECAGKNACKGLGGCAVTAEKLAELKAAKGGEAPAAEGEPAEGDGEE